jgi:hypothetical protein
MLKILGHQPDLPGRSGRAWIHRHIPTIIRWIRPLRTMRVKKPRLRDGSHSGAALADFPAPTLSAEDISKIKHERQ